MENKPIRAVQSPKRGRLLYQVAQEEIKSYITENSLKPGDSLPTETELAELLNISRSSLREAVKSLTTLGIVEARPGAGLFVRGFSFDPLVDNLAYGLMDDLKSLNEIIEVRYYLESAMAERLMEGITPEQIEQLQEVLNRMRRDADDGRYSAEDDREFHRILWANIDNTIMQKIVDIFWLVLARARERGPVPEVKPSDAVAAYESHLGIFNAVTQRDVAAFRLAMEDHWK